MSAHDRRPRTAGTAVLSAVPGWEKLSTAMTAEVPVLARRDDLLVTIAPGAGQGAPAWFLPARAVIEVDGTHLGAVDPATARPHPDQRRCPLRTGMGCADPRMRARPAQPVDARPPILTLFRTLL